MTITWFKTYVYFVFSIKVLFLFFLLRHVYFRTQVLRNPKNTQAQTQLAESEKFKKQFEFAFTILMATLTIYLYNPMHKSYESLIDHETRFLLFVFGIVVILTSDWYQFFSNSFLLGQLGHRG